jgi:hypothetical protein
MAGHLDEAAELFSSLHAARRSGDPGLFAAVQVSASYSYFLVGRLRDALDAADAALELTADQPELNGGGSVFKSPRGLAQRAGRSRWLRWALPAKRSRYSKIMSCSYATTDTTKRSASKLASGP